MFINLINQRGRRGVRKIGESVVLRREWAFPKTALIKGRKNREI